jgi:di/tricarboxylate transporter
LITSAIGLVLIGVPDLLPLSPIMQRTAGVVTIALGLWATGVQPPYFASIIFLFLAMVLTLAPARVVFSGFHSGAVWLVFGGLVLGLGIQKSGLGARAVRSVFQRVPFSFGAIVWALVLIGGALAFFIPSAVGRVMLLMPLVLAFADRLGFPAGSRGRTGLVLAAALGTMTPAFAIMPANVPNMGLLGGAESIYGIRFIYGEYLLLNYPVMGLGYLLALPIVITRIFRDTPQPAEDAEATPPWTMAERKILLVVVLALLLWATDFLHGVAPAWVALGAALLCVMPRVGLLPVTALAKEIDYGPWVFVAGIIGMGAVINETGLGAKIAEGIFAVVPLEKGGGPVTFATLFGMEMLVGAATTLPAAPGIMTPLADGISKATGWPLESVLYMQVPAWIVFPFPYQAPPVVVALALGGVSVARALKVMFPMLLFGVIILLPLQYLWGRLLGFYP